MMKKYNFYETKESKEHRDFLGYSYEETTDAVKEWWYDKGKKSMERLMTTESSNAVLTNSGDFCLVEP